jgi:hypothetical protein
MPLAGCYDVSVGSTVSSSATRVIARIYANGTFDTSLTFSDAYHYPSVFSSVASLDGISGFWTTGGPQLSMIAASPGLAQNNIGSSNGLRYLPAGAVNTTLMYNAFTLNSITLFGNTIYGTKNLLCCPGGDAQYSFGSFGNTSAPVGLRTPNFASFSVGGYGGSQVVFQTATIIWLAQSGQVYGGSGPYAGYLYRLTPSLTLINAWSASQYALPSGELGVRSMTGAVAADGATYTLYCLSEPSPTASNPVTGTTLWMFNTVYLTWSTYLVRRDLQQR